MSNSNRNGSIPLYWFRNGCRTGKGAVDDVEEFVQFVEMILRFAVIMQKFSSERREQDHNELTSLSSFGPIALFTEACLCSFPLLIRNRIKAGQEKV